MSDARRLLKVYVMDDGSWAVGVPKIVWKEVYEYCEKNRGRYSPQPEYYRIWARGEHAFDYLTALIQEASKALRKKLS
jgi:hypothetical protein